MGTATTTGTLDLSGFNFIIAGLTTAAGTPAGNTIGNSSTSSASAITYTANTSTFAGNIVDTLGAGNQSVSLTVTGGSLTLSGANGYTGGTNITAGTVRTGSTGALGFGGLITPGRTPGATQVAAGATLDLNGQTITEPITLAGSLINGTAATTAILTTGVKGAGVSTVSGPFSGNAAVSYSGGGGTGAAAVPVLGVTTGTFNISTAGSGYLTAPTVTITGGGGTVQPPPRPSTELAQ